jgi:hypothetical protein
LSPSVKCQLERVPKQIRVKTRAIVTFLNYMHSEMRCCLISQVIPISHKMKIPNPKKKRPVARNAEELKSEAWFLKTRGRVSSLESALNIKDGFFWELSHSGDDWSFLLKIHTLLEMAIAHLIQQRIDIDELNLIIEKVPMNGGAASKMKIASALSLLDNDTDKFLDALTKLRNKAAHQIDSVNLTMDDFIKLIQKSEVKHLFLRPGPNLSEDEVVASVLSSPRFAIWASSLNLLSAIYEKKAKILTPRLVQTLSSNFLRGENYSSGLKGLLDL